MKLSDYQSINSKECMLSKGLPQLGCNIKKNKPKKIKKTSEDWKYGKVLNKFRLTKKVGYFYSPLFTHMVEPFRFPSSRRCWSYANVRQISAGINHMQHANCNFTRGKSVRNYKSPSESIWYFHSQKHGACNRPLSSIHRDEESNFSLIFVPRGSVPVQRR